MPWLIVLLIKNGYNVINIYIYYICAGDMLAHALLLTHGTHIVSHASPHSHPAIPSLQIGGFMLPFVLVGSCVVVLMLIMVVVVHSTGITICNVPHLDISMAFSMDCSCLSILCLLECTSKTMSWRLSLRLLTNIMIVVLGKSFDTFPLQLSFNNLFPRTLFLLVSSYIP